jgi:hypothetical protein
MRNNIKKIKNKISKTKKRYYLINYSNSFLKFLFLIVGLYAVFFIMTPFLFEYDAYKNIFITITAASFIFVIFKYFISPLIKRKTDDFFALLLEDVSPGINNLIINAVQLNDLSREEVQKYGFSNNFIDLTIDEASKRIVGSSPQKAVSAGDVKKNLMIFSTLLLITIVSYFGNPDFFRNTYTKFLYPERFLKDEIVKSIEEVEKERLNIPEIGDFKILYNYPAYSKLENKEIIGSNGDIACLKGTLVTVSAKSDRPLKNVNFIFNDTQKIIAAIQGEVNLSFEFLALESGMYHLEFDNVDYPKGFEHELYQVVVEEDEFPFIKLLEPTEDITVEENDEITVAYEAGDDFGITRVNLVIERNTSTETVSVFKSDDNVKDKSGRYTYNLSLLKLIPGEVLKVYLETYDNDIISGPKKSVSNERYFDIYSKQKKRREIAKMKERLFETFIDLLGDHLEKSLVNIKLDSVDEINENQSNINSKTYDIIALLEEIVNTMKEEEIEDFISYIPLYNMMLDIQDLFDIKDKLLKITASDSYNTDKLNADVSTLLLLKQQEIKEAEKDIIYLDNENKKARMDDIINEGEDLLDIQKSLIDMLEELKEKGDMEGAKEQLEDILSQIEDIFKKIADKLSKFPQSLPDEFVNSDSMKDVDFAENADMMDKLRESLKNNDIEEALKQAEELLNSMNKMMASFENSASEFAQNETMDITEELDKAISKLDEMQNRQEGLMKDTKEINESAKEKRGDEQMKKAGDFIKKQQDLVSKIKKDMMAVHQELAKNPMPKTKKDKEKGAEDTKMGFHGRPMPSIDRDNDLKKTKKILNMLKEMPRMLTQDFNQAEKLAEDILEDTKELRDNFNQEEFKDRMKKPNSMENAQAKAADAQEKEEQLLKTFDEFKEDTDKFLSEEEKNQLKKMSKKQAGLKKDLSKFKKDLEKKAEDAPMLCDSGTKKGLEGAGKNMGEAEGNMKGGKAAGALSGQGKALSKLGQVKNSLQQMKENMQNMQAQGAPGMKPGGMKKSGMPRGDQPDRGREQSQRGRGVNVDDVNIPAAEKHRVPKEFREDFLKGMKEKYPKEYEHRVKKYYEELIR